MINELLVVAVIFVGGCAAMRVLGVSGWWLPGLGFLAGICLYLGIGFVQVATWLPTSPAITLVLTVGLPVGWWVLRWRRGGDVGVRVLPAVASMAGLFAAVVALRAANALKWHTDSLDYLIVARLLAEGHYRSTNTMLLVSTRQLGAPLLHAPANLDGELYLRSITPLLAVATIVTLVWFLRQGMRIGSGRLGFGLAAALLVLLMVTNDRVIHHAFYLNGHLLTGAVVLLAAASGWLLAVGGEQPRRALMGLQILAIPALVITRPEGALMGVLILLPTWLSPRVPRTHRSITMAVFGASTILSSVVQGWFYLDRSTAIPSSVTGPLLLGVLSLLAIPLLGWPLLTHRATTWLWLTEVGLWLALLALVAYHKGSGVMHRSIDATYGNLVVGEGGWGLLIVLVSALLVLGFVLFEGPPHQILLRFPVTTFVPFVYLMAYLREGEYRAAYADSMNRMIMHIVPLAVLLLFILATVGDRAGPARADSEAEPVESGDEPATTPTPAIDTARTPA